MGVSDRIRKLPKSFGPPDRCFRDGGGGGRERKRTKENARLKRCVT